MSMRLLIFLLLSVWSATLVAAAAQHTFEISGDALKQPVQVDVDLIRSLPKSTVSMSDGEKMGQWEGVGLGTLLAHAGAPYREALQGDALTMVVVVHGRDGHRVAFSLAEIDSEIGSSSATLAYLRDGKPLDAVEGPFRIVGTREDRQARWVRGVTRIEVRTLP